MECPECFIVTQLKNFGFDEKSYCSESCAFNVLKKLYHHFKIYQEIKDILEQKNDIIKLNITKHEPIYQTKGSSCVDISCIGNHIFKKNKIKKIPTGIYVEYLNDNYELQILSRSGLTLKGLIVLNSPGIIDSDYKGEIFVILCNVGQKKITIKDGNRIAQMKILFNYKIPNLKILEKNDHNGFGSTGISTNKKRKHSLEEEEISISTDKKRKIKNQIISEKDTINDINSI
jgi:dUTP pyrophosphatase